LIEEGMGLTSKDSSSIMFMWITGVSCVCVCAVTTEKGRDGTPNE
jgi:hypothetical protein